MPLFQVTHVSRYCISKNPLFRTTAVFPAAEIDRLVVEVSSHQNGGLLL